MPQLLPEFWAFTPLRTTSIWGMYGKHLVDTRMPGSQPASQHAGCTAQVRTVFNVAIGSDTPDIQRTAKSALLQMMNTVVKRVTQQPLATSVSPSKPLIDPRPSSPDDS